MGQNAGVDWDDPKVQEKIKKQNELLNNPVVDVEHDPTKVKCCPCPDCNQPAGHAPSSENTKPAEAEKASESHG